MAENKAIYTLVDTDMVRDYVTSNLCDIVDYWNGNKVSRRVSDEVFDSVVDAVIEKSTDGRLAKMIGEAMSTWIADKALDDVCDAITTFVTDEIDVEMSKHEKNEKE